MNLEADMDSPAWKSAVKADSAAVEHVLFNLIDNASKYAAGSSPAVVHLEAEPAKRGVTIRVRDHGKGVPPKERKRIFQAFTNRRQQPRRSRPGVGPRPVAFTPPGARRGRRSADRRRRRRCELRADIAVLLEGRELRIASVALPGTARKGRCCL